MFTVRFYLNDGEFESIVAQNVCFDELLETIYDHIRLKNPDWSWDIFKSGWADVCIHDNGKTYIRIRGVGEPTKGQTYYIIERNP